MLIDVYARVKYHRIVFITVHTPICLICTMRSLERKIEQFENAMASLPANTLIERIFGLPSLGILI